MAKPCAETDPLAPVFVIVDDDREAVNRLVGTLYPSSCFFIPVTAPGEAVRYAGNFGTTAVLLADPLDYPEGGTARLLQEILAVGKEVVILAEDWSTEIAEAWKRKGAKDCIPHPTRTGHRLHLIRDLFQGFTVARIKECR